MKKNITLIFTAITLGLNAQNLTEQQLLDSASLYPERADIQNELAMLYFKQKQYDKSAESMDKAIKLNPKDTNYYYNLASIYRQTADIEGQINSYKKFATALPCADAYNEVAFLYFNQRKFDDAISNFKQATHYNQKDYKCFNNIGIAYYQLGNFDSSLVYAKKLQTLIRIISEGGLMYTSHARRLVIWKVTLVHSKLRKAYKVRIIYSAQIMTNNIISQL